MTRTEICNHPFPALQTPTPQSDITGAAFFPSLPTISLYHKGRAFFPPQCALASHEPLAMRDHDTWAATTAPADAATRSEARMLPVRGWRDGQSGDRKPADRIEH